MKTPLLCAAAVLMALLLLPLTANAALIFQKTVSSAGGSGPPDGSPGSAILSLGLDSPSTTMLFEGNLLSEADEGQTFVATAANDSHFNSFVSTVTDGAFLNLNLIRVRLEFPGVGASTNGFSEPNFFFDDGTGSSGIDLIGFNIDSISMRVDQFDSPGIFSGNGNSFDVAYTVTFLFDGSPIPEPSRAVLLVLAVSAAGLVRRRRLV